MNVVIIEDETVAAQHLELLLTESGYPFNVAGVLDSIDAAVNFFEQKPDIDLVFMDIELGDGQSFDIFQQTSFQAPIIFTTAYKDYTLKAFKLNSIDYLLKPIDKKELVAAVDKFSTSVIGRSNKMSAEIMALFTRTQQSEVAKTRYLAKSGTRLISVPVSDISYFYTKDRLQYIKTLKGENYVIDKRLEEIEAEISGTDFFRVNRQFIVSYHSIEKVHSWFSGKLKVDLRPGAHEEILISRLKAAEFKKWLGE